MKSIIKAISVFSLLSLILAGCSSSNKSIESVEITNDEIKNQMKEIAATTIKQYFDIDINDGLEREEVANENIIVNKSEETKEHINNMFKATVVGQAKEGELYSYGVVLDANNENVQGAIITTFTSAKAQKYKEGELRVIGDQFILKSGIVEAPTEWTYKGIEKSASNQQFTALRYKKDNMYLLVGVSLHTGKVTYFEKTVVEK